MGTCTRGNGETYRSVALPPLRRLLDPADTIRAASGDPGIAKVYNGFIAEARNLPDCEALVLVHDDVEIVDLNFRPKVLAAVGDQGVGVSGVVGARDLKSVEWWTGRSTVGRVHETRRDIDLGPAWGEVDVVDGLMMILAPRAFRALSFDEVTCQGFHGYDVDYCLAARASGLRVVVTSIDVLHRTKGGYGDRDSFGRTAAALAQKWPTFIRPPTPGEAVVAELASAKARGRRGAARIKRRLVRNGRLVRNKGSRMGTATMAGRDENDAFRTDGRSDRPVCPVCGWSADGGMAVSSTGPMIVTCPNCGTGINWPPPQRDVTGSGLWDETYGASRLARRPIWLNEAQKRTEWLQLYAPEGCVLEIGCGTGEFVKTAQDSGYDAYGVEPSGWAAHHARGLGVRVETGFLADWVSRYPAMRPDVVAMWHVLEHVPGPVETLKGVMAVLAPGGQLVLEVPNFASTSASRLGVEWEGAQAQDHCFHYTPSSLTRLLQDVGFDVLCCLPIANRIYGSRTSWRQARNRALVDRCPWPPLDLLRAVARTSPLTAT